MFKVSEIANWIQAKVANPEFADPDATAGINSVSIKRLTTLKEAGSGDLAFFFSKHYQDDLMATRASVIVTGNDFVKSLEATGLPQWKSSAFLACADPYGALAILSSHFSRRQSAHDHQLLSSKASVHPSAVVHPTAKVAASAEIGANAVIEHDCVIEAGAVIYPGCYIGPGSKLGESSVLFPNVSLYERTQIGKRVRIHAGTVIGADGFGYAPIIDPTTKKQIGHRKIYHLGRVVIEDDVEIGANSSIDRGTMGDTVIRKQAKIDNQVQVGHNCDVGEGSVLCGAAGMAGSSSLGKFVIVGAQSGTGNQVHVGDYVKLGGYTGAAKDLPPDTEWFGVPARPMREFFRLFALQSKLLKDRDKDR